mmetsp:Transcript_10354/g.31167  ORF Transcript_10354/g.31167 Transcript_10354/m.31167 type:complete len:251 (-) Transcript_10354:131-883(-)
MALGACLQARNPGKHKGRRATCLVPHALHVWACLRGEVCRMRRFLPKPLCKKMEPSRHSKTCLSHGRKGRHEKSCGLEGGGDREGTEERRARKGLECTLLGRGGHGCLLPHSMSWHASSHPCRSARACGLGMCMCVCVEGRAEGSWIFTAPRRRRHTRPRRRPPPRPPRMRRRAADAADPLDQARTQTEPGRTSRSPPDPPGTRAPSPRAGWRAAGPPPPMLVAAVRWAAPLRAGSPHCLRPPRQRATRS